MVAWLVFLWNLFCESLPQMNPVSREVNLPQFSCALCSDLRWLFGLSVRLPDSVVCLASLWMWDAPWIEWMCLAAAILHSVKTHCSTIVPVRLPWCGGAFPFWKPHWRTPWTCHAFYDHLSPSTLLLGIVRSTVSSPLLCPGHFWALAPFAVLVNTLRDSYEAPFTLLRNSPRPAGT